MTQIHPKWRLRPSSCCGKGPLSDLGGGSSHQDTGASLTAPVEVGDGWLLLPLPHSKSASESLCPLPGQWLQRSLVFPAPVAGCAVDTKVYCVSPGGGQKDPQGPNGGLRGAGALERRVPGNTICRTQTRVNFPPHSQPAQ
ncbi:hypothetical protein H1C71_028798 [Ictidomys tridecemlineatus]|nr:hypothetical protein H1C71_028798 [Ictidomys tridecemlineatus]